MPNFWNFIAAISVAGIGVVPWPSLLNTIFRPSGTEDQARAMGLTVEGNGSRMAISAFSLVCVWAGARLVQTIRFPERWDSVSEMGWCVLIAAAIGSVLFVRRALASQFVLVLSLIGLTAMTVVTIQNRSERTPVASFGSPSVLNASAISD
jgi:hypothetical protein